MGTWGTGVLDDDLARDVYESYLEAAQKRRSADEIISDLRAMHEADLADPGRDAVFWLAVAHAQRDCGTLQPNVRARVEHAIRAGVGLEDWREAGTVELGRRKAVLTRFLASLSRPPSKRSRTPTKKQPESVDLEIGDCLSIELEDGRFAAAIVTRDHRSSTAPSHILTFIDATGEVPPPPSAFDPPRWLILAPKQFPNLAPKSRCMPTALRVIENAIVSSCELPWDPCRNHSRCDRRRGLHSGASLLTCLSSRTSCR